MKKLKLTNQNEYVILDDEDFEKAKIFSWHLQKDSGQVRGWNHERGHTMYLTRFLMAPKKGEKVYHRNHNPLDNRKENLFISRKGPLEQRKSGHGAEARGEILRESFKLPVYKAKKRECLKCNQRFTSSGPQERLCGNCRYSNKSYLSEHSIKVGS